MKPAEDYGRVPPSLSRRRRKDIEATLAAFQPETIAVDVGNIDATIRAREPDPKQRVRSHHQLWFRSGPGVGGPKYCALLSGIAALIEVGEVFVRAIEKKIAPQDHRVVLNEAGTPWMPLSWIKVLSSALAIVAAMVMAGMLITTSLVNAGMFETKLEASGTLIVPLVGPLALKTLANRMSRAGVQRFMWVLGTATVVLLVAWCSLFAATYAGAMSPEMPDLFAEEGEEATGHGSSWALMFAGLLAEAVFAAVLFLGIERIAESHQKDGPNHSRKRMERVVRVAGETLGWLKETARPRCAEIVAWHENTEGFLVSEALDAFDTRVNEIAVTTPQNGTNGAHLPPRLDEIAPNETPTGEERC